MPIKLNGSGSGSVALNAPANTSGGSDISFTLPTADGTSGQVLQTNGSGALSFASASSDNITEGNTSAEVVDTGSDGRFVVTTEGTERARIDSSGRLLVGTSSAIVDNTHGKVQLASDGGGTIVLGRNTTSVSSSENLALIRFYSFAGSTYEECARISAVADGTQGSGDKPTALLFMTTPDNNSSPTERMRITSTGRLNIARTSDGTSAAYVNIQVSSSFAGICFDADSTSARTHIRFNNGNGNVGYIATDGSSTTYSTSSDYRLKENVIPLTGAIDRVNQLQVHRFNFIADPDKTVDGFIAHEAQAVVPECVTGEKDAVDADGNPVYQGIDQSKLVPLLTAALQEALAKLETLEAANAALEARLTALEGGAS